MVYIGIDIGKSGCVAACPFYLPAVSFFYHRYEHIDLSMNRIDKNYP